jgi:hypothetical protein
MPNRIEAAQRKPSHKPPGDYCYCASSRLHKSWVNLLSYFLRIGKQAEGGHARTMGTQRCQAAPGAHGGWPSVAALPQALAVERPFAWLHHFRRLVIRWEYHVENFFGMVRLGCMQILLRHL